MTSKERKDLIQAIKSQREQVYTEVIAPVCAVYDRRIHDMLAETGIPELVREQISQVASKYALDAAAAVSGCDLFLETE